MSLKLQ